MYPMVIKDEKLLKNLFEMFSRFLDLLIQIDSGGLTND